MRLYHKIVREQPWVMKLFHYHAWTVFFWTFTTYSKDDTLDPHFIEHEYGHARQAFWVTLIGIAFNIVYSKATGTSYWWALLAFLWWPLAYGTGAVIAILRRKHYYYGNHWEQSAENRAQRRYPIPNQSPRWEENA